MISMELVTFTKPASLAVQDGRSQEPRTVDFRPHGGFTQSKLSVVELRRRAGGACCSARTKVGSRRAHL
jgi:hypothetical protein